MGREANESYKDASVLITGGTGSVGLALVRVILQYHPKLVRLLSNDENGLFEARSLLGKASILDYRLGDVRDGASVESAVEDCDTVLHAAALKHVDFCERNPYEATYTNIVGTQVAIDRSAKASVSRFVYVSTDKAVNPISVMGATKLLGEKLTISASRRSKGTKFSCVRFGNVLGSRGSVLQIFERQIRGEGIMTVTDPEMTRFIMPPSEAARLVLQASELAGSGETFVLKMPAVKIGDLAEAAREFFAARFGKDPRDIVIRVVGASPGEKRHEELLTSAEASRACTRNDFYVISDGPRSPETKGPLASISSDSGPLLSRKEIATVLSKLYLEREPWSPAVSSKDA